MTKETIPHSLAIIPARGGSKGLPRKNVLPLGGMPMIAYTIHAAIHSHIERVIVSTDDKEIADIAKQHGAEVPFIRPAEYSSDSASSLSVLRHALEYMENEEEMTVEHVIFLQPTSPFRKASHLRGALEQYRRKQTNSLLSVTEVKEFHPYFMFREDDRDDLVPLFEMANRPLRRQDLPPFYRINGAIYISKRSYYHGLPPEAAIFDWNSLSAYKMDAPSSVDINDYVDFQQAELILKQGMDNRE